VAMWDSGTKEKVVTCVLHYGCSSGTQDKVVAYVLHDVCSSKTVGHRKRKWHVCYMMDGSVGQWDTGRGSGICVK
jgi:hypothetical protein